MMKNDARRVLGSLVLAAACAAPGLGTVPALAQSQTDPGTTFTGLWQQPPSDDDRAFVRDTLRRGNAEIRSAQLALKRSHSADVDRIARMLIADHRAADVRLAAFARAAHTGVPNDVLRSDADTARRLATTPAGAFDLAWLRAQEADHAEALRAAQARLSDSANPTARKIAASLMPALTAHEKAIEAALGARKAAAAPPA